MKAPAELRKFVVPEVVFGVGARNLAGKYARNWALKKVLLVSDPGVDAAGWANGVAAVLEDAGIEIVTFLKVSPNPRDFEVMAGVEEYRTHGCAGIIAVGGGSVLDAAKGIGIVASNHQHILAFEGVDKVPRPMPPLICVPTTAGSSADVSQFAIINDSAHRVKIAIISKALVPDVSLIDPETLCTVDPFIRACTGVDALVHAIEAYVSNASSPITDVHALEAIRLLHANLPGSVKEPGNIELHSGVMLGSLEAGMAFSNASLGCVHAIAHTLGGHLDLPHGECNALLLPHVAAFNFPAAAQRYQRIAELLGLPLSGTREAEAREQLRAGLIGFCARLGIGGGLASRGIKPADIAELASKALRDPCNATNPREPSTADLAAVIGESL
jgi:alcohol dehydrogenase class IV